MKTCIDLGCKWGGTTTCHCSADGCHQTFGGIVGFDAHRSGPISKRVCLDPASVGLRLNKNGYWSREDTRERPEHWGKKKSEVPATEEEWEQEISKLTHPAGAKLLPKEEVL